MLPLGELVEDAQQVDAGEHVSPAVHCTEHQQIRTEGHSNNQQVTKIKHFRALL
jgi:hypothetical protein